MTENGYTGPSPQVLAAMRGEDPYAAIPQPTGPYNPQPKQDLPDVFDAGTFWKVGYDFTAAGVDATGEVPMPSQAKIDRYERTTFLLQNELEKLERQVVTPFERLQEEAEEAQYQLLKAKSTRNPQGERDEAAIEKHKAEIERLRESSYVTEAQYDEAKSRASEIYGQLREALSILCSNKPTKKQLEGLPDNMFIPFKNYIEGKLNPNS